MRLRTLIAAASLSIAAGCIQITTIDVRNDGVTPNAAQADIATETVRAIAEEFGFVPDHPANLELRRSNEWDPTLDVASFVNSGSKGFGGILISLGIDKKDGHLAVRISNGSAYGPKGNFVESLEKAMVDALSGKFPGQRIDVETSRW